MLNLWTFGCHLACIQTPKHFTIFFLLHVSTSIWWLFCPDLCSYRFWFLTSVYSVVADLWCRYHEQHIVPWHLPCNRLLPGPHVGLLSWDNSDSLLHLSNGWVGSCAYDIPPLGGFHCHCSLPNFYWLGSLPWLCMWMALDGHNRFRLGEMYIFLQELLSFFFEAQQQTQPDKLLPPPSSSSLAEGWQEFQLHSAGFEPRTIWDPRSQNRLYQWAWLIVGLFW